MKSYRLSTVTTAVLTSAVLCTGLFTIEARDRGGRVDQGHRGEHRAGKIDHHRGNRVKVDRHDRHGHVVRSLPHGYRTIRTPGRHYYCHGGVYYARHSHGYEIVKAPRFHHLPRNARRIVVNRGVYYVCDDVYYRPCDGWYEVCERPVVVEKSIVFDAGPLRIVLSDRDVY